MLAAVMHWPLPVRLGTDVPKDLGDPLPQAWQVAWGGHALAEQPGAYWQSNQFWPFPDTLAFSDALVGLAPGGLVGSGPEAALARYGLLFLFAHALATFGAYVLARTLGLGRGPAAVCGVAFAYTPWRIEQGGHLHVLSSGGIPLALALLLRGHRDARPLAALGGWLVAAWQLSLSFSLGILLAYVLAGAGAWLAWRWWRTGRPRPGRVGAASAAGAAVFLLTAVVLSRPYLRVLDALPEARRDLDDVAGFSEGPWTFLVASPEATLWGPLTAPVREHVSFVPEHTLFPGLAVLLLAVLGGRAASPLARGLRRALVAAVLVLAVLSVGAATDGPAAYTPYRLLYEVLPGFSAIRVPTRLHTLTTLALAVLAAGGTVVVLRWLRERRPGRVAAAAAPVLVVAVLLEGTAIAPGPGGLDGYPHPKLERPPAGLAGVPAPQLHLPAEAEDNRRYLLWSTDTFPALVNGRSSVNPRATAALLGSTGRFPDADTVGRLRALGVRSVVLHRRRLAGTPWAAWPRRPVTELGIARRVGRDLVVYDLRPRG